MQDDLFHFRDILQRPLQGFFDPLRGQAGQFPHLEIDTVLRLQGRIDKLFVRIGMRDMQQRGSGLFRLRLQWERVIAGQIDEFIG